jgi:large subunit ribosomal protein L19
MNAIIQEITQSQLKERKPFKVGDGIRVRQKIREGDKEREQTFSGMVISIKGSGIHQTFTVCQMSFGIRVEKIFNMHSPNILDIEVEKVSIVRNKKRLYHVRKNRDLKVREERLYKKK